MEPSLAVDDNKLDEQEEAGGVRGLSWPSADADAAELRTEGEDSGPQLRAADGGPPQPRDGEEVEEATRARETVDQVLLSPQALAKEVARRRNFAIISHPDAGKTTLVSSAWETQLGALAAARARPWLLSEWRTCADREAAAVRGSHSGGGGCESQEKCAPRYVRLDGA